MSDRDQRLAELFARAVELPAPARDALLRETAAADAALGRELTELLAADAGGAARALEALVPAGGAGLPPGTLVAGRYRIRGVLGEGGMGVVYAADQLQPARRVALKCMRQSLATAAAQQRFDREAALLGRLRHPGIAQILEAGSTGGPDGQPFFVMELVPGPHLHEFARELPRRAQLELFAAVADAVQHAHAAGIVHRDLKPANVLVDTSGPVPQPKVLDFGVARTVDAEGTLLTRSHEILGTLAFLAPEQLGGGAAAAPSADVWSLGVMLYQLLAGRLPFALDGLSLVAAARVVQEQEPPALDLLAPALRGDVATIVHTCLAKDPDRRYRDAGALAADLRRHLANEPIAARPPSALYRLSRFARRHRAVVAGLGTTIAALAAGLVVSLQFLHGERTQRARAEQRAGELRALARELVFEVDGKLAAVPGATAARQQLLAAGLRYAESLLQDAGEDPERLTEVGGAFLRLAEVQGDPSDSNLGDLPAAQATLARATAALDRALAHGGGGSTLTALHRVALVEAELARAQGHAAARREAIERARALAQRMHDAGLGEPAARALERASADLGRLRHESGDHRGAVEPLQSYATAQERRLQAGDTSVRGNLARVVRLLGHAHQALGASEAARPCFRRAVELGEADLATDGAQSLAAERLADALRDLAAFESKQGHHDLGLPLLQRARELLAALPDDGQDIAAVRRRMVVDFHLVDALVEVGRLDDAAAALADYLRTATALQTRTPQQWNRIRDVMVGTMQGIGLHSRRGDGEAALRAYRETVALVEQCAAAAPDSPLPAEDLAKAHRQGGEACLRLGAAGDPAGEWRQRAAAAHAAEAAALRALVARGSQASWVPERLAAVEALLPGLLAGR